MIVSFADKDTEKLANGVRVKRFEAIAGRARTKLLYLDGAGALEDLARLPGNRLEALSGDREGQYSIRINEQYRLCFEWREGNAYKVEIIDYH
ncbi:MAG TPA: type II toxin-antitoxin system RelE/ParE family toxin [Bryobacteraceae bacterium]